MVGCNNPYPYLEIKELLRNFMKLVVTDADNTLWDTDALYAKAQLGLLESVASELKVSSLPEDPLAFIRMIDQELASQHHLHLRYPPDLLVHATGMVLEGDPVPSAVKAVLKSSKRLTHIRGAEKYADKFINTIIHEVAELRDGVYDGLIKLKEMNARVIVATEGKKSRCDKFLCEHGLDVFTESVVEARKNVSLYKRLMRLDGASASSSFMIGDQLDRDIQMSKEAGFTTVYFPAGFKPEWMPSEAAAAPDFVIESFSEVPSLVASD